MLVSDSNKKLERFAKKFDTVCSRKKIKVNVVKKKVMRSVRDGFV